jgi:hypothetical protein
MAEKKIETTVSICAQTCASPRLCLGASTGFHMIVWLRLFLGSSGWNLALNRVICDDTFLLRHQTEQVISGATAVESFMASIIISSITDTDHMHQAVMAILLNPLIKNPLVKAVA